MSSMDEPRCAVAYEYGVDIWKLALETVGDEREVFLKGLDWWNQFATEHGFGYVNEKNEFVRTKPLP